MSNQYLNEPEDDGFPPLLELHAEFNVNWGYPDPFHLGEVTYIDFRSLPQDSEERIRYENSFVQTYPDSGHGILNDAWRYPDPYTGRITAVNPWRYPAGSIERSLYEEAYVQAHPHSTRARIIHKERQKKWVSCRDTFFHEKPDHHDDDHDVVPQPVPAY